LKFIIWFLAAAILSAFTGLVYGQEQATELVLARVNDMAITQHDIDLLLSMTGEKQRLVRSFRGMQLEENLKKAIKNTLSVLVEETVIEANAGLDKFKLDENSEKKVEEILKDNAKPFGTRENYELALKENGITVDDIESRIRKTLLRHQYIQSKLAPDDFVRPEEARGYYLDNKSQFSRRETVTLRQIVIRYGNNNRGRDAALKLIQTIEKSLEEGSDFGALAKQFSEGVKKENGGLWSPEAMEDLHSSIVKAIKDVKENEVSSIVERPGEFLIIKVEKRNKSLFEPFQKALSEIVKGISNMRQETRFPELEKEMYRKIEIELLYKGTTLEELCPTYVAVKSGKQRAKTDSTP